MRSKDNNKFLFMFECFLLFLLVSSAPPSFFHVRILYIFLNKVFKSRENIYTCEDFFNIKNVLLCLLRRYVFVVYVGLDAGECFFVVIGEIITVIWIS